MSLKIRKLPGLFLCICLFALAGCGLFGLPMAAQQGGGLTAPTVQSQAGNKSIVPSATALTVEITNFCNGQAQTNYGWLVQFCDGSLSLSNLPVTLTSTMAAASQQGQKAWCYANQWTNSANQLSVPKDTSGNPIIPALANCPSGVAPAPVTAPSGASATPAKS